jgi:Mg-chelatase subunit ChlD
LEAETSQAGKEGFMSLERAWVLVLLALPLFWVVRSWAATTRRAALLLKAGAMAAILLALAEPRVTVTESRMAVVTLVDTSASIPSDDLLRASEFIRNLERSKGRHWVGVVPFARGIRELEKGESLRPVKLIHTPGDAGRSTDLEAAVREGLATAPAGYIPRVVLISDGRENRGSVNRAVWQARQLGIPIDTVPMAGRPKPGLVLESITLPSFAFTGDKFPIELTLTSPQRTAAVVEIGAEGKILGTQNVTLERGENQVRVYAALGTPGAIDLSGRIKANDLGELGFSHAVSMRRPRLLYVSQDPPAAEAHLMETLAASQFEVTRADSLGPEKFADYEVIVLNNQDLESIPESRKNDLEAYVKRGGGLLVIGGERNRYVDDKNVEDALERTLPAKLAPPRNPEGTCVVLIIDKSSSMEGRKIELARLAAIGVIENLRAIDAVGVLIFDNSFQWAVPIRKAEDRSTIKRLVAGVMPDGGTQIAPALAEAYRRIVPQQAVVKHIVLLTDGISEEGDSIALAREAATSKVTISTVGLGQDVNRAYLEKVASYSKGKSYFLADPSGLEQILMKDVMEHTGTTTVEKNIRPVVVRKAEVLEGVDLENAPPLRGYVRYESKPTADTLVTVDKNDPLLARWQFGLGRAVVFTSDAKSRWAERWVGWAGFDRLWANICRDLLPHTQHGVATAEIDSAKGDLVVTYRLSSEIEDPPAAPAIYAFGPDGFQKPVEMRKTAAGTFRGTVPVGSRRGLFRVRPVEESRAFPEIGIYRQQEEMLDYGSDEWLLKKAAELSGGRFNPQPRQVFDSGGRSVTTSVRLWPALLALAIALNLAELLQRKWPWRRAT